jgi:hypothetical protein
VHQGYTTHFTTTGRWVHPDAQFWEEQHHIYVQEKKDPREEWVQMKYKITKEDIQLIMQDWDLDWKVPGIEQRWRTLKNKKKNRVNDQGNGQGNDTDDAQNTVPKVGNALQTIGRGKRKDKGKGPTSSTCNKMKVHNEPTIYTLDRL